MGGEVSESSSYIENSVQFGMLSATELQANGLLLKNAHLLGTTLGHSLRPLTLATLSKQHVWLHHQLAAPKPLILHNR
jgi:hypothetical protein